MPQIGLHGAAQRQHRLSGPHGANELSGAEAGQGELPLAQEERSIGYYQAGFDARWELDLFGRIAAATDAARASAGAAEADLRAARVSVAAEAVRAYIELRGAQRRHQVLSGLLDDQRHLLALVQERRRAGIASDFDVDRASVLEAETAAQLPLSAQLARQHAASGGAYWRARSRPGCWRPPASPCRAASRPRRCRPISCASGRTSVARNSRCCRPRPNYGCRSPSYTRA